jgi:hypothetical protein
MNFFLYPFFRWLFTAEYTACLKWGDKDIILNNLSQMFFKKLQLKSDGNEKSQNGRKPTENRQMGCVLEQSFKNRH